MILYSASSSYYSMIGRYALLEAGLPFEHRRMDIHLAKEQLSPWYMAINPAMTVPALVDNKTIWTDSQDILKFAASQAGTQWMDADPECAGQIDTLVKDHYAITIERLTFGKALNSIPLLRFFVFKMLRNAISSLESQRPSSSDEKALEAKILLNKQRLAYFSEGSLEDKLAEERNKVRAYLQQLPTPKVFLFGDKISSVDIVTVVLLGRLKMIGEYDLVVSEDLKNWFSRMQLRSAYKEADIWTYFQPWRIILKR
ncbi:glutathione S-transferase family protein [Legionella worsleiensis]|uniref:Tetrachloro-P-hydroquinone reductive dehalogenase n=1 Tax=Legionella worsleiensis TaxID=45076 RepID=A0A0W1A6U4_9GAMM|nr:glutathione S-transferase family protein [Legionella worsleiensis]KTD76739.1 Tetrachloro-P-hydroquinone reductive dehalogenase [Legionella worsleiensis]STY30533.1 Tetrachloro-P-hydroquinone reductive dehalogenase [Legionella worsleiensis]